MTNRKKNTSSFTKILILVFILIVPGFVYYFLSNKVENRYKPLPYLGPKELSGTFHSRYGKQIQDTIYHRVPSFTLRNEDGGNTIFPEHQGTISVVNFFYTHCPSFCLKMNNGMNKVAKFFASNNMLYLYSISVDSTDKPMVLKQYGKKFRKENTKWKFLMGSQKEVFKLANQDFLLNALRDTSEVSSFIHSPYLVLLDSQQHIRGYYDTTDQEEVDRLINEIKLLITEELRNKKTL